MPSMYDTILELPLFKGIGEEQLSLMLEKTPMEFLKFEDGDVISKENDKVDSIDFILSGRVRQSYQLDNFPITIDEILIKGSLIGALHLFGMVTHNPSSAIALGKVSVMRMGKTQYMNLLQSHKIYILNFVNYLSAGAQKSQELFIKSPNPSIMRTLKSLAYSIVSRRAETVIVAGTDEAIAQYCGVTSKDFLEWKNAELSHNRIMANQRGIILKSPHLQNR